MCPVVILLLRKMSILDTESHGIISSTLVHTWTNRWQGLEYLPWLDLLLEPRGPRPLGHVPGEHLIERKKEEMDVSWTLSHTDHGSYLSSQDTSWNPRTRGNWPRAERNGDWTVGKEVTRDTRKPWRKCNFGGQEQFQEEIESDEARAEVLGPANGSVEIFERWGSLWRADCSRVRGGWELEGKSPDGCFSV